MNGSRSNAQYLGRYKAESFSDACRKAAERKGLEDLFNEDQLSIWGCRLFQNEKDARESFG
jgi:hypothetical protein